MPIFNSNTLATRPQNALGSSVDETAKSIPASKLPFEFQDDQTSTSTRDQFDLYT